MRAPLALALTVLALAGCSSDPDEPAAEPSPTTPPTAATTSSAPSTSSAPAAEDTALRDAVTAYSDAFLTGDADAAFDLLSTRCQGSIGEATFGGIVDQAGSLYGAALEIRSYDEQVDGDSATVTYTYDAAGINQTDERWLVERGVWRNDDC